MDSFFKLNIIHGLILICVLAIFIIIGVDLYIAHSSLKLLNNMGTNQKEFMNLFMKHCQDDISRFNSLEIIYKDINTKIVDIKKEVIKDE